MTLDETRAQTREQMMSVNEQYAQVSKVIGQLEALSDRLTVLAGEVRKALDQYKDSDANK